MTATHSSRLRWLLMIAFGVLFVIAGINIIIDPYHIFSIVDKANFNHSKFAPRDNVRLVSAYQVERIKPQKLLLGSSRVAMGFDPRSEVLGDDWYNLAQPGISLEESIEYLRHAIAVGEIETVVFGLDIYLFDVNARVYREDFDLDRLASADTLPSVVALGRDMVNTTLSFDALRWSAKTYFLRDKPSRFIRGYWNDADFHQSKPIAELQDYFKRQTALHVESKGMQLDESDEGIDKFLLFFEFVEICYQHEINLFLFFHPNHRLVRDKREQIYSPNTIHRIKQRVINKVKKGANNFHRAPYPIWDFSGPNEITDIALTVENHKKIENYFYEPGHYKAVLGDMVICKMMNLVPCQASTSFGKRLL